MTYVLAPYFGSGLSDQAFFLMLVASVLLLLDVLGIFSLGDALRLLLSLPTLLIKLPQFLLSFPSFIRRLPGYLSRFRSSQPVSQQNQPPPQPLQPQQTGQTAKFKRP